MKKSALHFMTFILFSVLFIACGNNESDTTEGKNNKDMTPKEKIQGKWIITEAEGEMAELNKGTVYTFDGDNYGMAKGIIDNKGKILEMTDNSYKAQFDGMQTEYIFDYTFDGEKLIITPTGSGQIFTLERK